MNGKPAVTIAIQQLPGSNANEIQIAIGDLLEKAGKSYPIGVKNLMIYNTKVALMRVINRYCIPLLEAFFLCLL